MSSLKSTFRNQPKNLFSKKTARAASAPLSKEFTAKKFRRDKAAVFVINFNEGTRKKPLPYVVIKPTAEEAGFGLNNFEAWLSHFKHLKSSVRIVSLDSKDIDPYLPSSEVIPYKVMPLHLFEELLSEVGVKRFKDPDDVVSFLFLHKLSQQVSQKFSPGRTLEDTNKFLERRLSVESQLSDALFKLNTSLKSRVAFLSRSLEQTLWKSPAPSQVEIPSSPAWEENGFASTEADSGELAVEDLPKEERTSRDLTKDQPKTPTLVEAQLLLKTASSLLLEAHAIDVKLLGLEEEIRGGNLESFSEVMTQICSQTESLSKRQSEFATDNADTLDLRYELEEGSPLDVILSKTAEVMLATDKKSRSIASRKDSLSAEVSSQLIESIRSTSSISE